MHSNRREGPVLRQVVRQIYDPELIQSGVAPHRVKSAAGLIERSGANQRPRAAVVVRFQHDTRAPEAGRRMSRQCLTWRWGTGKKLNWKVRRALCRLFDTANLQHVALSLPYSGHAPERGL
jgi:hypothetical protein